MEQKIELLEIEQQILRQEIDSLREIINVLQTQISESNNFSDSSFDLDSDSDEHINQTLVKNIVMVIEAKLESFKGFIKQTIEDALLN